ncbi:UNVERIFIED_CONTAM: hypothetical protein GTU68_017822, partial [Idotea baltica]|nr:hypothetical protein [Idotea baltica]
KFFNRKIFADSRGCLSELFREEWITDAGIDVSFVQDNYSRSAENVVRGLHYQLRQPQAKLLTVTRGAILDVGVDLRKGSSTFAQWFSVELSEENGQILYLPVGFAHGFSVIKGPADVQYKCSDIYVPDDQFGLRWDDPKLNIDWGLSSPVVSERDAALPLLSDIAENSLPEL